jgi:hypothetical protein
MNGSNLISVRYITFGTRKRVSERQSNELGKKKQQKHSGFI